MNQDKGTTKKTTQKSEGFTDDERAAVKERAKELKMGKANGESALLTKIA